ncbi:MAG: hypothetical protein KDC41_16880 [Saprospiraceae bacterium]|nr:hypothetical protein [Saprospiraceae bacterium]
MNTFRIGLIFNGVWSQYAYAKATKYRDLYELLYVHELDRAMLERVDALAIPFQSNHRAIAQRQDLIYDFLAAGKRIFVEGDSSAAWLKASWEDRPVNNYWWVKDPHHPPLSETDDSHPIYRDLSARQSFWHYHGVYTRVPDHAWIVQRNVEGEVITWQTGHYGGSLLVTTLDPIVEHGVQQITHLDHYCDRLTEWLIGVRPGGKFEILPEDYGVRV